MSVLLVPHRDSGNPLGKPLHFVEYGIELTHGLPFLYAHIGIRLSSV